MEETTPQASRSLRMERLAAEITSETFDKRPEDEQAACLEQFLWWHELHQAQKRIDRRWEDQRIQEAKDSGDHEFYWELLRRQRRREREQKRADS